ncbi:hypothetical protein KAU32_06925 [bacterium]|nr:hypothetical protein [bacterium]
MPTDKTTGKTTDKTTGKFTKKGSQKTTQETTQEIPQKIKNEGLNEGLKTLLECIRVNPGIQAKDISKLLNNRPIKTIERQISDLKNRQLIERKGSRKTGGYYITDLAD